ncbi:ABC transporter permease subunit [Actinophytocola sp.]|uniref:ABC transporter permease subunit n=1 Tax=Actinophytocola sp. TaxID=1872138 RepID=UPI002D7FEC20|nr:ABC transporter permease subunit [Actinophytocola sp.]HET9138314.1 ABC transporter permease subunit [Actinophytocola sp.]
MIWLTWRQFRTAALAVFGALAAFAVILAITGPALASEYATGIAACGEQCGNFLNSFYDDLQGAFLGVTAAILVLPPVIGVFWGAPLISRELEAGTHRLVWNQSITRTHWLAVKLTLIGLAVMTATALASVAVTWWSSTVDQVAENFPRLGSLVFDARGIVPIGYSAFAFALGVVVGMLIRRTLPAMAVTLAVFVAVQLAMPFLVRPYLLPSTQATVEISESILDGLSISRDDNTIRLEGKAPDPGGWLLSSRILDPSGTAVERIPSPANGACTPRGEGMSDCLAELNRLGYRAQLSYHPPTRFWPFQWIETGIYLAATLTLGVFCFWWLRRRVS